MNLRNVLPVVAAGLLFIGNASNASAFEFLDRMLGINGYSYGGGGYGCDSCGGCDTCNSCNSCGHKHHHGWKKHHRGCGCNSCCAAPTCGCAAEPTCGCAAPTCAAEPTCGCAAAEPTCGCAPACDSCNSCCGKKHRHHGWKKHHRGCGCNSCCVSSCEPTCGCGG